MYTHLLLPTDGSALSNHAIDHGVALAANLGAAVTILTVVEPFQAFNLSAELMADVLENYEKSAQENANRLLQAAAGRAHAAGVEANTLLGRGEHPHTTIIQTADDSGCDLIVMASHGRRGVSALLMGSETQKVLTHSTIPVLVIRHKA
jgi:nucleotide-binding universal stress UspA family protein